MNTFTFKNIQHTPHNTNAMNALKTLVSRKWRPAVLAGLLAGILFPAAPRAAAQPETDVIIPLRITITATVQQEDISPGEDSPIIKHVAKTVRWTTAKIISLMATNLSASFPKGAKLVLVNNSPAIKISADEQTDVSSLLTFDSSVGTPVKTGQENEDTGNFALTQKAYTTITFDDGAGNAFTLTGCARSSASSRTTTSMNSESVSVAEAASFSFTGTGYGTVNGAVAVFTGTISGSGTYKYKESDL
jgi:hypothetical protein